MPNSVKRIIPWLFSFAIVGYLFWSTDLNSFMGALRGARMEELLMLLVGFALLCFVADSATLYLLFGRLVAKMPFSDILAIKGVSYFFNVVTYSAGTGGMAIFLYKKEKCTFLYGLSTLLWLNFIDIIVLLILMLGGTMFGRHLIPEEVFTQLPLILAVGWSIVIGALIYWFFGVDFLILGPMRKWRIFEAYGRAKVGDYLVMICARLLFLGLYLLLWHTALPTFHVELGLAEIAVYMPLLTFVQIIPASVSGLGAVQVVMIMLFAPHVLPHIADPQAQVLALSTVIGPATNLVRLIIGYCFVTNISRDFVATQEEIAAVRSREEAEAKALRAND